MRVLGIPDLPELRETPRPNRKAARSHDTCLKMIDNRDENNASKVKWDSLSERRAVFYEFEIGPSGTMQK